MSRLWEIFLNTLGLEYNSVLEEQKDTKDTLIQNMEDYVDVYKKFFDDFNKSVDTTDQLPVKIIVGNLRDHDIIGCVIDWTQQYLSARQCPSSLIAQICKFVVTEMQVYRAVDPENCGYQKDSNVWNPLKLMQATIKKVIGVCQRHKDRNSICKLSPPRDNLCLTVLSANKNARRTMEDKFTVIDDFHEMLNIEGYGPGSFYGVFDGHGGAEAAMYGASRLFQCLAECPQYPARPDLALVQAFKQTDAQYVEKAKAENLQSGTTAVVAILLQQLKQLYIAWIGDTQAIISRAGGKVSQLVSPPHRPNLESEKDRIEQMGGCVLYFNGQCRVQGTLAVSRAIGDKDFKPYVCADPDVLCLDLDGSEDFLLLATDGLWEEVSELEVAREVYTHLSQKQDQDLKAITDSLIKLSKARGSKDNITVLLVFLRPPSSIPASSILPHLAMESPLASNGPPHYNGGAPYHTTGAHEDDFGPETDVDGESAAHVLKALKEERNASQKGTSSSEHALNISSSDSEGEEGVEGGGWDFVQGRGKEPLPSSLQTSHKTTNFDSDSDDVDDHPHTKVNNEDDDLDDMNHPLNPDAAEFVPVTSPVKSPTSKLPWETDNGVKHDIENGFDKKSFDLHAGNGVDLIGTESNGVDIHHAFDKNHHELDGHKNGDGNDHDVVDKGHATIHDSAHVDMKNHPRSFDDDVVNDEITACSPKKPKQVYNVEDEDIFLDDIKQRPSSGFEAKENGDHENGHDDLSEFESLDVSKAQATLGDSTINYMADLSTTVASPHHGNLLSEDYTTSSLSPSSPHGAADSQASNPFDPTWTDKNETHDFDRHTDFEEKHNDFGGINESVEKTIEMNETNGFSSDFTGANNEDLAVDTSAKIETLDETLLLQGEENLDQEQNLEDVHVKHAEEKSHSDIENEIEASKKDAAFEDQFEDKLDVKPSAPFDPADNVKADDSASSLSNIDLESQQEEVDVNIEHHGDAETTESSAKFDANTFNEFHTATDQTPTSLSLFPDEPPQSLAMHSVFAPISLVSQTPLDYAEETYQTMLDIQQTPNSDERRISNDVFDAYNAVAHCLDTPGASKHDGLDLTFGLSDNKESEFGQQEESTEFQPKQESIDEAYAQQKEEFGVKQENDDALNGSCVEESHVETRGLVSSVEDTQEINQFESQLRSEHQDESEQTGDNEQVKAETDLHQTLQTEEFEFHREDNVTSATTLDETTNDDFNSYIAKQEHEGNVETITMGGITAGDFVAKHDAFVEQNVTEEDNVNEIVRDTNVESSEVLTHVEANVTEALKNVSESIQEEEEDEEIQIGKTVSNLNESDVMSQSFYGNYDEEPARSPSPEEMIDHYEKAQQEQEQLAADESSRFDSSVEAGSELTPTTETTTLEAKLAQDGETKHPEEEQKTAGQLFEISHEETSYNKSAQEQFDDLTFGSKTSESSIQQEVEEVVEQSAVTPLETNLDDIIPQETKIESEFLESKDAEAKEEVSGPVSVPDVVPTQGNEDSQTPAVDLTQDIVEESTLPAGENIEPIVDKQEASVSEPVANETVEDTSSTVAKAAAAVGAAAVVGAAAAVAAKKSTNAVKKPTAASATKKTEVKAPISKTSTGAKPLAKTTTAAKPAAKPATTTLAKKPATTAAKSTLAAKPAPKPLAVKPAAPKPSTTTAAKPAPIRRPVASTVTKTTTTGVSAAPKPAAAKPAPKPAVSAAPRPKPATTTATKPLTNGVAKRPVAATSTASPRTTTTTSKPAAPTKPIAPRVPLSQRTTTTTSKPSTLSSTVKKTSTSTTAPPARKPLSSVTSKVGSNLKPKVGATGTTKPPSSSNAIKKTESKTSSGSTTSKPVTKPVEQPSPAVSEIVASPVMTNGH